MNEKFTPAPWEVHDCSFEVDKSRLVIGHRQDGRLKIICRLPRKGDQENYANAVLMKFAPEMYEALKKIAEKEPAEYYECGGACDNCYDMIDLAREVLGVIEEESAR